MTAVAGDAPTLHRTRDCTQPEPSTTRAGAGAAQPGSKIAHGSLIRDIFLGGPIDGAAAASNAAPSNVSRIALGGPIDGAAAASIVLFTDITVNKNILF